MCLLTVEVMRMDRVNEKVHMGFKVFKTDSAGHLFPLHFGLSKKYFRRNEWYNERDFRSIKPEGQLKLIPADRDSLLTEEGSKPYPLGFHIFTFYEDAVRSAERGSNRTIRVVEYKEVLARGKRSEKDIEMTVVARQMRITTADPTAPESE